MTKQIPLTKGRFALVDDDDHLRLMQHKWCVLGNEKYGFRATRMDYSVKRRVLMHREIMGEPDGHVDHINGDSLDNRKENLRVCTHSQNMKNRRKVTQGKSSRYKGVHLTKSGKWCATIFADGQRVHVGTFDLEIEAAVAYDKAASRLHGDFAALNLSQRRTFSPRSG